MNKLGSAPCPHSSRWAVGRSLRGRAARRLIVSQSVSQRLSKRIAHAPTCIAPPPEQGRDPEDHLQDRFQGRTRRRRRRAQVEGRPRRPPPPPPETASRRAPVAPGQRDRQHAAIMVMFWWQCFVRVCCGVMSRRKQARPIRHLEEEGAVAVAANPGKCLRKVAPAVNRAVRRSSEVTCYMLWPLASPCGTPLINEENVSKWRFRGKSTGLGDKTVSFKSLFVKSCHFYLKNWDFTVFAAASLYAYSNLSLRTKWQSLSLFIISFLCDWSRLAWKYEFSKYYSNESVFRSQNSGLSLLL